ncbi:type VI secretion system protein ImpM [Luteibacter rhizovicinus]|uniref:Type VI secretion system protein ImpM n=1 Tax=Luteibacter rhizovicinus TaxID=242606 RepID=A0A4R3YWM8_9GAMM|nr:type VI secretion system-associated protein TagF [Luteibacter rhizovicinus]TCV95834.1 type VI secretion system protein ImpM [Luteibacter rhizovicinus]
MQSIAAPGFFGKLPGAGDFVQRRLPSAFVDVWDRHFSHAVAESRDVLGERWQSAYRASPLWRFLLAPGVCTGAAWAGVLGPATDRVGRHFPMVIAGRVATDTPAQPGVLCDDGRWFAAMENVFRAAQAVRSNVETFDAQVAALTMPVETRALPARAPSFRLDRKHAVQYRLPLPESVDATALLTAMWTQSIASSDGWCLWWSAEADRASGSLLLTAGLPDPALYAGFLEAAHIDARWPVPAVHEPVGAGS